MISRSTHTWAILGACLALAMAAVGWLSVTALRLHRSENRARADAAKQENARLALWRMDVALTGLIEREAAHSPADFLAESRLSLEDATGERVRFYFQLEPNGSVATIPAVGARQDQPLLSTWLRWKELEGLTREATPRDNNDLPAYADVQQQRNAAEFSVRNRYVQQFPNYQASQLTGSGLAGRADLSPPPASRVGPVSAIWLGPQATNLALIRHARVDNSEYVQGCVLNWPAVRAWLLAEIKDLLPAAELEPRTSPGKIDEYMVASLPVRLVPGVSAHPPETAASLLPGLAAAWGGILLAASALVVLLIGTSALSERRASFVSAVTHELRTPLTTFRMYTEMLARGMISEDQRKDYLDTLNREANRLGHLVENVLAYSRVQSGRALHRQERIDLRNLVEREERRWNERVTQAAMKTSIEIEPGVALHALGDATAVEQVLFNLVDNACKYAHGSEDNRIHVSVQHSGKHIELRVKDHGPGIHAKSTSRLFEPFHRSSEEAASSAPGVGLGLALSRRLARQMGGDLKLETTKDGATFVLKLLVNGAHSGSS